VVFDLTDRTILTPAQPTGMSRWSVPVTCLFVVAGMTSRYIGAPDLYTLIPRLMIKLPAVRLLTEWAWIPASVRCWSEGVDVYVNNTCYKSGDNMGFNYSPMLLHLGFLKYVDQAVAETAIAGILLFFALFALPSAPDRRAVYVVLIAAVSSGTMVGVERTNVDIFIYLLVFAAIPLSRFVIAALLSGYFHRLVRNAAPTRASPFHLRFAVMTNLVSYWFIKGRFLPFARLSLSRPSPMSRLRGGTVS